MQNTQHQKLIIRWAVWGDSKHPRVAMLADSVHSFRRWFNSSLTEFIVVDGTDDGINLDLFLGAKVLKVGNPEKENYYVESAATWRKWMPTARLLPGVPELYVDSDVFCLKRPDDLITFLATPGNSMVIMQESSPEWFCYGNSKQHLKSLPKVNAGLVGQQSDLNIEHDLFKLFQRWLKNVGDKSGLFHDEQGSIAEICENLASKKKLLLLPTKKYAVASPRTNSHLTVETDLAIVHCTYPDHPYYHLLKDRISRAQ